MIKNKLYNRFAGTLVGLAVGDALGTSLEFTQPDSKRLHTRMVGGGVFNLKAGQWTDDTSMALCLADSLIECEGFNPYDQLLKYLRWYLEGYNSSTGSCFDIGNTTLDALLLYKETRCKYCGSTDYYTAGNGSIMRLAPIVIFYFRDTQDLLKYAGLSSKTTHANIEAIQSCQILALYIQAAMKGVSKIRILSKDFAISIKEKIPNISSQLMQVVEGSYKSSNPPAIIASGYCVKTLEAALWAFYKNESFKSCLIQAVNLCNDADTVGAVAGQIAGAYYGYDDIPFEWNETLYMHDHIKQLALN